MNTKVNTSLLIRFTHNKVDECKQEEQHNDAHGNVAFSTPQPCLVQSLFLYGHVSSLEVTVVFLTNGPSLNGLLSH